MSPHSRRFSAEPNIHSGASRAHELLESIVGQFIVVDNRDQRLSVGAVRATIALVDGCVYQTLGLDGI